MSFPGRLLVTAMLLAAVPLAAQSVRSHTRMNRRGTTVSRDQAVDLTLTVTPVSVRPIQVWVRTAGAVSSSRQASASLPVAGRVLDASVAAADAPFVKVG